MHSAVEPSSRPPAASARAQRLEYLDARAAGVGGGRVQLVRVPLPEVAEVAAVAIAAAAMGDAAVGGSDAEPVDRLEDARAGGADRDEGPALGGALGEGGEGGRVDGERLGVHLVAAEGGCAHRLEGACAHVQRE